MIEKPLVLTLPPGFAANGTKAQAAGRWYDGNLVRFFEQTVRSLGGLAPVTVGGTALTFTGYLSRMLAVDGDNGVPTVVFAGTNGLHVVETTNAGSLHDITPAGFTAGLLTSVRASDASATGDVGAMDLINAAQVWQLDNFGTDVLGVDTHNAVLYAWGGNLATAAAAVTGPPAGISGVVVTPERFVVTLGSNTDHRLVQWASQGGYTDWTPTANNTAGDFTLSTSGALVAGRRGQDETLLWTNEGLHRMRYVGEPFIYGFDAVAGECGLLTGNAVAMVGGNAFWMGDRGFFAYDGAVHPMECEVHSRVFDNFNWVARDKVWTMTRAQYGEVWWFYPSASATSCDSYVIYNYREKHWTTGQMAASAGTDKGPLPYPMLVNYGGAVMEHDRPGVVTRAKDITGAGWTAWVASGPLLLNDGQQTMRVQHVIPDEGMIGTLTLVLNSALLPSDTEASTGSITLTPLTDVRVTAKRISVEFDDVNPPAAWQIGAVVLGVVPGGTR